MPLLFFYWDGLGPTSSVALKLRLEQAFDGAPMKVAGGPIVWCHSFQHAGLSATSGCASRTLHLARPPPSMSQRRWDLFLGSRERLVRHGDDG